jgi:LmbE family N-acetylglucosaminyl deacetylase
MRVVGIGAHPDDIEIYFVGFLALAQSAGHATAWIIATDGAAGGSHDPARMRGIRREEARAGAAVFGLEPICLDLPDGGLSEDRTTKGLLEAEIRRLEPDLVITHAPNDYHPDHRALSECVASAASFRCPVLFADTMLGLDFTPSTYVDVSDYMEKKKRAIALHASQPVVRFTEIVEVWNRFRGLQSGKPSCQYAEAFRFEPRFPFGSIDHLIAKFSCVS